MKCLLSLSLVVLLALSPVTQAQAQPRLPDEETANKGGSGLPLPRFASFHVEVVNMRTGPGTRYPIEWVYLREGLPVEITKEFDIWRRVRDWEGSEGWVHKSALSGKRTAIVVGKTQNLHKEDNEASEVLAKVEPGAIGRILACEANWCEIKFNSHKGYLPKTAFWGVYQDEVLK